MTAGVFAQWLHGIADRFAGEGPVWVVYDHARAHLHPDVERVCRDRGLTSVLVPKHATSFLQVHDTHVNKTFRAEFRRQRLLREVRASQHAGRPPAYTRELFATDVVNAMEHTPTRLIRKGIEHNVLAHMVSAKPTLDGFKALFEGAKFASATSPRRPAPLPPPAADAALPPSRGQCPHSAAPPPLAPPPAPAAQRRHVYRACIRTLAPRQKLNDEIIDVMMALLCAQCPGAVAVPTWQSGRFTHGWKVDVDLPPGARHIVVPLCYRNHWSGVVCRPQTGHASVLDSLPDYYPADRDDVIDAFAAHTARVTKVTTRSPPMSVRPQRELNECGVHLVQNVAHALGLPSPLQWNRRTIREAVLAAVDFID